MNCADAALSVFYPRVLTRWRIFLHLWTFLSKRWVLFFFSGLPTWSTDNLCSLQWRIVQQGPQTQIPPSSRWGLAK